MRIHDDTVAQVRERSRIIDLFSDGQLKKTGREFVARCPWHDDHRPSLTVSPRTNRVHCFVCARGADAIGWLQEVHGLSFSDSVLQLADRYNVQVQSAEEIQLLTLLADTEAERDLVAADYAEVSGQVVDLELQRRFLTCEDPNPEADPENPATICEAEELIESREADVESAQSSFQFAAQAVGNDRSDVREAIDNLADANQQLLQTNQAIEAAEVQVEYLAEQAGGERYEPTSCCEDRIKTDTTDRGEICCATTSSGARDCSVWSYPGCDVRDCGEVCQQISNVQSIVDQVDAALEEVQLAIESTQLTIEDKQADLNKYLNATEEIAFAVVRTKDQGLKSEEDLREQLQANVDLNEYLAEQDPWPPGNA